MPQSTKDSHGGKTHATTKTKSSGSSSGAQANKPEDQKSAKSPVGPSKHGGKKTTP